MGLEEAGDVWIRYLMRHLSEKFVSRGKSLCVSYMDLEKAYNRTGRVDVVSAENVWCEW